MKEAVVYQNGDQIEAEVYFGNENIGSFQQQIEQDLSIINSKLPLYKNVTKVIIRETEFPKTSNKKSGGQINETARNISYATGYYHTIHR